MFVPLCSKEKIMSNKSFIAHMFGMLMLVCGAIAIMGSIVVLFDPTIENYQIALRGWVLSFIFKCCVDPEAL